MNRKLSYNTIMGVLNQVIVLACNFILPRQILLSYGSETNGLITSITQFLGFITLMEMGVGAVVQAALYKPLAEQDHDQLSRIVRSARSFFHKIGLILLAYIVFLCFFYKGISHTTYSNKYIVPLVLAISITNLCEYFIGITNQILLNADQRSYIQLALNSIAVIAKTAVGVALMRAGASVQMFVLLASVFLAIKPLGLLLYVRKHYQIDKQIEIGEEPIRQKWNGIAQHLASFVLGHTDVLVLTLFSSLGFVSVYNVYYMIVAGVRQFINVAMTGVMALFGNLYAQQSKLLEEYYGFYEWIMHMGVSAVFTITALLICPFISVYTSGVNDINYIYPYFGILMSFAFGIYCIRLPYNTMVLAAGHFKETQASAIIEAAINIVVSIVLVRKYGIYGVAAGTLAAMLYRTVYLAWYLGEAILYRPFYKFINHILIDLAVVGVSYAICANHISYVNSYLDWIRMALPVSIIVFAIAICTNCVFYKKEFRLGISIIKKRIGR